MYVHQVCVPVETKRGGGSLGTEVGVGCEPKHLYISLQTSCHVELGIKARSHGGAAAGALLSH